MPTYVVKTDADSRSNRRRQTFTIVANSADEAIAEAEMRVYRMIRGDRSVWAHVVAINGVPQNHEDRPIEALIGGQYVTLPASAIPAAMAADRAQRGIRA